MPHPSAVVLVVDRLSQGFLGAYGNTVVHTPEFDRLAAESFVFDNALIADPRLEATYEALWGRGTALADAARSAQAGLAPSLAGEPSLVAALNSVGIHTALLTDEPLVATLPAAADFAERELLDSDLPAGDQPLPAAADVADCAMARVFAAAADWIERATSPFLLWIHARGLAAPWDAPYALRAEYADEEDPPPPPFVAVPDRVLPNDVDPDELLGVAQAYCGQVTALDACLDLLRGAMVEAPLAGSTLFCLLSSRGTPLGEHGQIGGDAAPLFGELVAIPWIIRLPGGAGALGRSRELVQHQDLPATLRRWWRLPAAPDAGGHDLLSLVGDEGPWPRQWAVVQGGAGERAIRTPAWYLRWRARSPGAESEPQVELFAKPSDRWEVNEVAARAPHVCEALAALVTASTSGGQAESPLPPELIEPMD